jgi:EpsI family protein
MSRRLSAPDRRSVLIGTGLAAAGAFSYLSAPKAVVSPIKEAQFRTAIPDKVGGWVSRRSQELILPPQDDSNKLYENQETRIYQGAGLPSIMFLIAFSSVQQNDIHVHRPEVCYPAGGFPIKNNEPISIGYAGSEIKARELIADRGGLDERIIYWIRVASHFPTNWQEQRLAMAISNLSGSIPDGVLFRVSAFERVKGDSAPSLRDFIVAFLNQVTPSFRNSVLL